MKLVNSFSKQDGIRFSLCTGMILLISILHYGTSTEHLELHDLFEHLYYIPVLLIAFWYGPLAGIGFALFTSAIYLVHILRDLAEYALLDPLTHLLLYNLMALIVGSLSAKAHRNLAHFKNASAELSEAYEKLKNTSESLRRTERLAALGQLSAGIAHEIRNPLGSIKGAVDILTSDIPEGHPKEEFVEILRKEVSRINKLIEEFLRFARPPRPRVDSVNLSDLVSSSVRLVEGYASRNDIEIERMGGDRTVEVDEDQMRQVLLNLFLNAIEAMPGGGTLRIEFAGRDDSGSTFLRISDTGNGVERVELDRIFDPFYTTKPHGTGLGLSISHQLVRNHGGQLSAEINPEGGLTVTVELPADPAQSLSQAV